MTDLDQIYSEIKEHRKEHAVFSVEIRERLTKVETKIVIFRGLIGFGATAMGLFIAWLSIGR